MHVLLCGDATFCESMSLRFSGEHSLTVDTNATSSDVPVSAEVVFDAFTIDMPDRLQRYASGNACVFYNVPKTSLAQVHQHTGGHFIGRLFGFNGLPGLIESNTLELSYANEEEKAKLSRIADKLMLKAEMIEDTVGMVSPRILAMIINEAYFTTQEGTASASDIDTAMRLGTNYPKGPLEWASAIGIRHIAEVLLAVQAFTGEERYRLAPALHKAYLATLPSPI